MAWALDAEEVLIWKDVPGLLNADPKKFDDTFTVWKSDKFTLTEKSERVKISLKKKRFFHISNLIYSFVVDAF